MSVRELLADERLGLNVCRQFGMGGFESRVRHNRIQRVGLALAGHFFGLVSDRVQVCGQTEMSYVASLGASDRLAALQAFFEHRICCVLITGCPELPTEFIAAAEQSATAVVVVLEPTGPAIAAMEAYLDDRLAPRSQVHGVLVDVFGVGMLLLGTSGVGKSECALDLVLRGHRLVADDIVQCESRPSGHVFGSAPPMLRHHIEVRGIGILNVQTLFGVTSVRDRKRIDVVVELRDESDPADYDRLGVDDRHHELLGLRVRQVALPVRAGRDMAAILEIVARDELSRRAGYHSARDFYNTIERSLREGSGGDDDSIFGTRHDVFRKPTA